MKNKNLGGYKMISEIGKQIIFSPTKKPRKPKKLPEDFTGYIVEKVEIQTMIIKNEFSELKITSPVLSAYDFKVLSAFYTYIFSNIVPLIPKSKSQRFLRCIEKREYDRILEEFFTIKIKLYSFIKDFMKSTPGTIQYNAVINSLEKLYNTKIELTYEFTHTKTTIRLHPISYLLTHENSKEVEKNEVLLGVSYLLLYLMTEQKALFLSNDFIQKTKSPTATALVSFLQTTTATRYSLSFLSEHLRLERKRKNRTLLRDMRNAFKELVKIGYLSEFKEEKKENDDTYFTFKRAKELAKKKQKTRKKQENNDL